MATKLLYALQPGQAATWDDPRVTFVRLAVGAILKGQPVCFDDAAHVAALTFGDATCVGVALNAAADGEEVGIQALGVASCVVGFEGAINAGQLVVPFTNGVIVAGSALIALGISLQEGVEGDFIDVVLGLPIRAYD